MSDGMYEWRRDLRGKGRESGGSRGKNGLRGGGVRGEPVVLLGRDPAAGDLSMKDHPFLEDCQEFPWPQLGAGPREAILVISWSSFRFFLFLFFFEA